jgi:hypothetical protein
LLQNYNNTPQLNTLLYFPLDEKIEYIK